MAEGQYGLDDVSWEQTLKGNSSFIDETEFNTLRKGIREGRVDPATLSGPVQSELNRVGAWEGLVSEYGTGVPQSPVGETSAQTGVPASPVEDRAAQKPTNDRYAGMAATISSVEDDYRESLDKYKKLQGVDARAAGMEEARRGHIAGLLALREEVAEQMRGTTDPAQQAVLYEQYKSLQARATEVATSDLAISQQHAESIADEATPDEIDMLAVDYQIHTDLQELSGGIGIGEKIRDWSQILLVPGNEFEDALDIDGDARATAMSAVQGFNAITDPQEKWQTWQQIKEWIKEHRNSTEAVHMLAAFASGQSAGAFPEITSGSAALSGVDLGATVLGAAYAPFTATFRRVGNSLQSAKVLGNYRGAAKMAAQRLREKSNTASGPAGTKLEAADEALRIQGLAPEEVASLSPQIQKELTDFHTELNRTVEEMVSGESFFKISPYLPKEVQKMQASINRQVMHVLQQQGKDVESINIKPGTTADSIVLEITSVHKGGKTSSKSELQLAKHELDFRNAAREGRRPKKVADMAAEVDFELQRIKDRLAAGLSPEKAARQLQSLITKKSFLRPMARLVADRMRSDPELWAKVIGDLSRGRYANGARRMKDIKKKLGRNWDMIKDNPALAQEVRNVLRDSWKEHKGKKLPEPKVTMTSTEIKAKVDDTVGWLTQESLPMFSSVLSNRGVARTEDTIAQLDKAAALDNLSAKVYNNLGAEVRNILRGLNTKGANPIKSRYQGWKRSQRVQKALIDGDEWVNEAGEEIGKVFSQMELRQQFGMDDQEIAAYYKARHLFDNLHIIRNQSARQELMQLGYKDIRPKRKFRYTDKDGNEQVFSIHEVGKPLSRDEAKRTLDQAGVREVLDTTTFEGVPVTDKTVRSFHASNRQVVRLREPVKHPVTGKLYQHVVVHGDEIAQVPKNVLTVKAGYVPRVYDRGVWFVRVHSRHANVDGRPSTDAPRVSTLAMADNQEAARRLAARYTAEGDGSVEFRVSAADEVDPADIMSAGPAGGGRLYTGKRGDKPVPMYVIDEAGNLVEQKASRMSAWDALHGNISNIAFHYPRGEWRIAEIKRLENTAKKLNVEWNGIHAPVGPGTGGPKAQAFMERQRSMMRDWLAMPDAFELKWQNMMQHIYESALKSAFTRGKVADLAWFLKSHNPVTALRGATFHLMLGMLNPVQTFVQAQGFAIAASMNILNPAEIGRVWRMQSALGQLMHIDDAATLRKAAVELRRAGLSGTEADDLVLMADAFRKSGLKDGVLTNGDFAAMEQGFGQIVRNGTEFLNEKGLFFYRAGELFNRRFSFVTAFRQWADANPEAYKKALASVRAGAEPNVQVGKTTSGLEQEALGAVIARANDYMLNLGRANRASWQKGLLSVPTQFWQVQAKLLEEMFNFGAGAVLTRNERFKLFAGQIALYGAAGVPILGGALSYDLDYNDTGIAADPDSVLNRTFDEGIYGLVFAMLGADVEVSKRGAILSDLQNLWYDFMLGDKTMTQAALGATNSTLGRLGQGWKRLTPIAMAAWDTDQELELPDLLVALDAVGDMATSWSNLTKAYVMASQDRLYSRSSRLLDEREYSLTTLVATTIGFTPRTEAAVYDGKALARMYAATKADMKISVRQLLIDYMTAVEASGGRVSDEYAQRIQAQGTYMLRHLHEGDRIEFFNEIQKELQTGDTEFAKVTNRFISMNMEANLDDMLSVFQKSVVGGEAIDEESIK